MPPIAQAAPVVGRLVDLARAGTGGGLLVADWATLRAAPAVLRPVNRGGLPYAEAVAAGRAGQPDEASTPRPGRRHPGPNSIGGDDCCGSALRADLAAYELTGEHQLARTCRALLRRAGAPVRRGRGATPVPPCLRTVGVTSRERDVLALVTTGLTNARVAERLFLSPRTVETHVASPLTKTGAASRMELGRWARTR